jgi:hypothetical protein
MAPSPDNGAGARVRGWSRVSLAFALGFLGVAGTASALLSAAGLALPGFLSLLPTLWRRLISTSA